MSNTTDIWKKYKKINVIGTGTYGKVYKVQNIENGYYYAIKEIDKTQNILSKDIQKLKTIDKENNLIKEIIDTKEYLYIIMELCEYNLENYIKKRENIISINEIREILIQLNSTFKIMRLKK
jgi:serine/threonine protein kinase